ncbi:MAG: hypothetical protein FWB85_08580 [Chitinispirillia bacterium]|nr:hypothetical protein [Chitinispirillia bacterium]MCL2242234.1 hypothetical protein [Chitinispirillia bacterium]
MKNNSSFVCPVCGALLPANAKVCRDCGSDDTTGWSENTYMDGIDLPYGNDEYEEVKAKEFGEVNVNVRGKAGFRIDWKMVIGIIVLLAMILAMGIR